MPWFKRRPCRPSRYPELLPSLVFVLDDLHLVRCRCARRYIERLRGLLGTTPQTYAKEALLLSRCSSIHTNGMAYPIDVMFIDVDPCNAASVAAGMDGSAVGTANVLAVYRAVPAGKVLSCKGARAVVERPASANAWPAAGDVLVYVYRDGGAFEAEELEPLVRT